MATFQKRKTSWRVQVRRKGEALSATFDRRGEAEAWAIATEAKILAGNGVHHGFQDHIAPVVGPAAKEVFTRYAQQVSPGKRGGRWEEIRINMLIRRSRLFDRPITAITGPDMAEWRDERLGSVSPSTVNRELCLISSIFTHALKEWRVGLTFNPCALMTKPRKPRPRTQRVSADDRKAIIAELGWNGVAAPKTSGQWVAFAFYLALETAMRKGEMLSLRWSDIDLDARHVRLDLTKNGDERDVPLSRAALTLLQLLNQQAPDARVIPVQAGNFDKLFRNAKRRAGLSHIHFHDSRREAATTMAPKLSNVLELAAITGHKSLSMLQIYYKPSAAELAARLDD